MIKRIGITEQGDPVFNKSWISKMDDTIFSIIISKGLPDETALMQYKDKIIFHATTTGYGGSVLEPNVAPFKERLAELKRFSQAGFPQEQIVVRIDPIICTEKGVSVAEEVLKEALSLGFKRFRYSFIDLYGHVKERFTKNNLPVPVQDFKLAFQMLKKYESQAKFESCAENTPHQTGCISALDCDVLGVNLELMGSSNQRKGCLCPGNKMELLTARKPCGHKCLYCYWKD